MRKGRARLGVKGEMTKRGVIRPGTRWVGINGMMEGEDIGRTGLARRLEISPGGIWWTIVGKGEEGAEIQVKGRTRSSSGMERMREDKFESIEERVEGSEGG